MEKNFSESEFNFKLSERLLVEIKGAIEEKLEKYLAELLKRIPLKNLPFQTTNQLLILLLKDLEDVNFVEGLKVVLQYWSSMETGFDEYYGEIYPIIPTLFLDPNIPFTSLYFIMNSLQNVVSIEEVCIDLFEKGSGDQLERALTNLFDMLPKPSGETFRILMDEAYSSQNKKAIEFISGLQRYHTEPVPKPKYIIEEENFAQVSETELVDLLCNDVADEIYAETLPDTDDIEYNLEFLTQGFQKFGLEIQDIEQTKNILRQKLESMSQEELKDYMRSFVNQDAMNALVENTELFNILGPANPIINGDFRRTDHICYKYGGCRMLFCNCFEVENVDENMEILYPNIPQWFQGQCENCNREIKKRCYAIRRPLPQGGWRGTYCSWNCLHLSGNVDDKMSLELANIMEKQINETKIYNREEMDPDEQIKIAEEKATNQEQENEEQQ